jgi:hypothetical protein
MSYETLYRVLRAPCARPSIRFCRKDSVMRDLLTSSSASAAGGFEPPPIQLLIPSLVELVLDGVGIPIRRSVIAPQPGGRTGDSSRHGDYLRDYPSH